MRFKRYQQIGLFKTDGSQRFSDITEAFLRQQQEKIDELIKKFSKTVEVIWGWQNYFNDLVRIEEKRPLSQQEKEIKQVLIASIAEVNLKVLSTNLEKQIDDIYEEMQRKAELTHQSSPNQTFTASLPSLSKSSQ